MNGGGIPWPILAYTGPAIDGVWFIDQNRPMDLPALDVAAEVLRMDWRKLDRKPRYRVQVRGRQVAT